MSTQVLSDSTLVLSPPRCVGERVRERGKAAGNRRCCSASKGGPGHPGLPPHPILSPKTLTAIRLPLEMCFMSMFRGRGDNKAASPRCVDTNAYERVAAGRGRAQVPTPPVPSAAIAILTCGDVHSRSDARDVGSRLAVLTGGPGSISRLLPARNSTCLRSSVWLSFGDGGDASKRQLVWTPRFHRPGTAVSHDL